MAITEEGQTMSAAVDTVVRRCGMPNVVNDIVGFVRLTIRECEGLKFFKKSWIESQVTPDADPYTWTHPDRLRALEFAQYPHMYSRTGVPIDPVLVVPNRAKHHVYYYYSGADYSIFGGHGGGSAAVQNPYIDVGYFQWQRSLPYFATAADRPARFDILDEVWEYHDDYDDTTTLQETARNLVQNWLLRDWFELIVQGALSKVYHTYGDQRASPAFAAYKQAQQTLEINEKTRDTPNQLH